MAQRVQINKNRISTQRLVVFVLFITLSLVAGFYGISKHSSIAEAYVLATTHQPEQFSQLYFNNSSNLPNRVTVDKKYSYSIHLVNQGSVTKTYRVKALVTTRDQAISQKVIVVTLAPGNNTDLSFVLLLPRTNLNATVMVAISNSTQAIYFRTTS